MVKKSFISFSLACLLFSNANSAGIPTVDVASITQSVKNYGQMLKQYNQMVKDTLNFEKQMKELGVDMRSINDILGDTLGLVQDMQKLYDSVTGIPDDILGDITRVQNTCSYLERKSPYVKNKINQVKGIQRKINRCMAVLNNPREVNRTINELTKRANRIADYNGYQEAMQEIENIKAANAFLQSKQNEENANRIMAFYDTYKEDKSSPYSQKKQNEDIRKLARQASKANNQKQAQALTNSLLLKLLESNQRQYEMNLEYYNTMTAYKMQEHQSSLTEEDYQKTYTPLVINESLLNNQYQDSKFEVDSLGFPIITLDSVK